ncbi:DNA-directed RNA polymerases II, IV and V subunit 9A-like [Hibiscus syriacus]|uniref:DNA-directed RNA polymerases II, IV and V subunit 9A-like n=1 Tax=Hibiscus syriacus TaxID=106335 RepID=UPI001922FB01|nr:DNA-directed RNA polymerases II, IV and V subunit 9A-like [Hibiscus syriacus]
MADSARDMEGVKASNQPSGGEQMLETKGNDINSSSSNQPSPSASSFDGGALPDHDPPPTENGLTVGTVSKEEIDKYKIYRYNKPKLKLGVGNAVCNNILYPRKTGTKILLYACRNCDHQEVAENNCVYRNEVHHSAGERTQVLQDVAADPTLPRTKAIICANCKHGEAVFFQATARGEEGMTLFFVCCNPNCGHRWRD